MHLWEYCEVAWMPKQVLIHVYSSRDNGTYEGVQQPEEWGALLAQLGADGWELVGVVPARTANHTLYYFKRPLASSSQGEWEEQREQLKAEVKREYQEKLQKQKAERMERALQSIQEATADDRAAEQLTAIDEVHRQLEERSIAHWLLGGWAVDFYAGAVTRRHSDIDLAVWLSDLGQIRSILRAAGWVHAPDPDEDGGTGYERGGTRLELTYLVDGEDGTVYTPLHDGRAHWSREALAADVRGLLGARCRLVGLAPLTRSKASPRPDPQDGAKDRADYEVLRHIQEEGSQSGPV